MFRANLHEMSLRMRSEGRVRMLFLGNAVAAVLDVDPIAFVETQTTMLFLNRTLKRQSYAVVLHGKPP